MVRSVVSLIFGVILWMQVGLAYAQTAAQPDAPLMGSEATALPQAAVAEESDVVRVLVIGDGLAGGLGAGMTRMVQNQANFEIYNRFNESSGLARREVYDWSSALAKIVAAKPVDAVVVLVGANDRQEIRNGNVRHAFKSPEWVKGYEANVDQLIDAVKAANAKLYWISVPPMANSGFDADMQYLNALHRQRVAAKQENYIDVRPFFVAADGGFLERGPDDTGAERKLRDSDGVKFMKVGNNRFGQLVLGAIKALRSNAAPAVAAVVPEAAPAPAPTPVPPKAVVVAKDPPTFGQTGLDGETVTFRADSLKVSEAPPVSVAQRSAPQVKDVATSNGLSAFPGSNAAKLLIQGVAGPAPAGRFDDFSVPALAP
jgi:uncharacterized protein